jgi:hypothetical protein
MKPLLTHLFSHWSITLRGLLSIRRVDVMAPNSIITNEHPYHREITILCGTVSDIFSSPIAAASLGQVYKLRLKEDGSLIGLKVQRLDMHHSVLR